MGPLAAKLFCRRNLGGHNALRVAHATPIQKLVVFPCWAQKRGHRVHVGRQHHGGHRIGRGGIHIEAFPRSRPRRSARLRLRHRHPLHTPPQRGEPVLQKPPAGPLVVRRGINRHKFFCQLNGGPLPCQTSIPFRHSCSALRQHGSDFAPTIERPTMARTLPLSMRSPGTRRCPKVDSSKLPDAAHGCSNKGYARSALCLTTRVHR